MASLFKPTYTKIDPKTGERRRHRTKKWYGQYQDANGQTRRVPLSTDREAAQTMLSDRVRNAARERAGLRDPAEDQLSRPLSQHVADFRQHLESRNNSGKHVRLTINRLQSAIKGCDFKRLGDFSASRFANWLTEQRQKSEDGISIATSNHYLQCMKAFGNWLTREGRLPSNPFLQTGPLNAETDRRRERRALSDAEFQRLLKFAARGDAFRGLSGADREMLYLTAAYTGLREAELASLTLASLDLAGTPPTVTIEATCSKRRRRDVLPLHGDLAGRLRKWLAKKPALTGKLWPGSWWRKGAEMLRSDLAAAGIPYVDEAGRVFDFHALRGQFITQLGRMGVTLQEAQKLARHSDPRLTANFYTHLSLDDLSLAVAKLPSLQGTASADAGVPHRQQPERSELALPLAQTIDRQCPDVSDCVRTATDGRRQPGNAKPLPEQGFGRERQPLTATDRKRRRPDSNRGWRICNPLP